MTKMNFIKRTLISAILLPIAISTFWLFAEYSPIHQIVEFQVNLTQTDSPPCFADPLFQAESKAPQKQTFIDGQETIEIEARYAGQGKMQDLFYRYPCPSSVPDGLSIHPGK